MEKRNKENQVHEVQNERHYHNDKLAMQEALITDVYGPG